MAGNESEYKLTPLTAISPLDGRYRDKVEELVPFTSEYGLIKTRVEVEGKYLLALSEQVFGNKFTDEQRETLENLGSEMTMEQVERVKEIEETTRHDVKAVERWIRESLEGTGLEGWTELVHFGLTSEDINNLSYRLMLDRARKQVIIPVLDQVVNALSERADQYKAVPMLGRTHGQPAIPTTLGKEFANFAVRLNDQVRDAEGIKLTGKLNGAIGNFNALALAMPEVDWVEFSQKFVKSLGLEPNIFTTQINPYEDMIKLFQAFQRADGIIIDADQDIWRYISDKWFVQKAKEGEIGSSTMPQKVNPIRFENSEGNSPMANGVWETMGRELPSSRLQRDLSDSTVIRNVGVGLGHQLLAYKSILEGLDRIDPNLEEIREALNENWSILTEGVQTVLRKEGIEDAYMLVKELATGQKITPEDWEEWVGKLPIEERIKKSLRNLTPENYIGEAERLTDLALNYIEVSRTAIPK